MKGRRGTRKLQQGCGWNSWDRVRELEKPLVRQEQNQLERSPKIELGSVVRADEQFDRNHTWHAELWRALKPLAVVQEAKQLSMLLLAK